MRAACYGATRNMYANMIPAIKSLLMHSNVEKIYLMIEDREFPYELPPECECIDVSKQKFFKKTGPNYKNYWTYMALMKAALHRLLPESVERVLMLDCDTIVDRNIDDVWEMDLHGKLIGAVWETFKSTEKYYYNAGVLIMDLKGLRETGLGDAWVKELNTVKYHFCEQDSMNVLFEGKILTLDQELNCTDVSPSPMPRILHFAGHREFVDYPIVCKYREIPWSEIRKDRR